MNEPLLRYAARLKQADRENLNQRSASEAQAEVEAVLNPRGWKVKDESQLVWPGDLAEDEVDLWFRKDGDGDSDSNGS